MVWGFLKGTVLQWGFSRRVVTVVLGIFEITVKYGNIFGRNTKITFVAVSLSRKVMEQCRLCPAKSEPSFFAPQNCGDMVSGANRFPKTKISPPFFNFYCKSLLFQRPLQPFGPRFGREIFCVAVPLRLTKGF